MVDFALIFILILFGLFSIYVFIFYSSLKTYPPGPLPLPVLGNLLSKLKKRNPYIVLDECCKKYGKVSTFWFGSKPAVIIFDFETAKYAFNIAECCGRPFGLRLFGFKIYGMDDDINLQQKTLRKLTIGAIRNLLSTNKVSSLISESAIEVIKEIKTKENNCAFKPELYMNYIIVSTMSELTFGQKYSFGDKQLNILHEGLLAIIHEQMKVCLTKFVPFMKYFLNVNQKNMRKIAELNAYNMTSFESCKLVYKPGMCDNFTNALLTSRLNMIDEGKVCAEYLSDENIRSILMALLIGGIDTTLGTLNWIVLIMSHYTDIQLKLREEVNNKLGEKLPDLEDKKNCHFLNAFICEVLRFSAITPFGLLHNTLSQVKICDYTIPKDTILLANLYTILNDPLYWSEPEKFMPERFLDSNGLYISSRFPAFVIFSFGKRMCVGEKMAQEMLFLALVCLLQSTRGYQFVLENGPQCQDLEYDTKASATLQPNAYKIILKQN